MMNELSKPVCEHYTTAIYMTFDSSAGGEAASPTEKKASAAGRVGTRSTEDRELVAAGICKGIYPGYM
jgi:hypothetical protein